MLVENKFIFLLLPRCASYSFHITCLQNKFDLKFFNTPALINGDEKFKTMDVNQLVYEIPHMHERIVDLQNKFGDNYPVIGIKRNKYERFISIYKKMISEFTRMGELDVAKKFASFSIDDVLFFKKEMLLHENIETLIFEFIKKFNIKLKNIEWEQSGTPASIIKSVYAPLSLFHNHNPNIIWFDINNMVELENWVSDITNTKFKMIRVNDCGETNCNLVLNDEFKKKYDEIYSEYDNTKIIKSII